MEELNGAHVILILWVILVILFIGFRVGQLVQHSKHVRDLCRITFQTNAEYNKCIDKNNYGYVVNVLASKLESKYAK